MKSSKLKPNQIFKIGAMETLYQVDLDGKNATKVLDNSGGHARKTINLDTEPEFEATELNDDEIQTLKGNPAFTGTIPK